MTPPVLVVSRRRIDSADGCADRRALPGLAFPHQDQEHTMTMPVPAACTTAAAVRTEALGPALDLIAIAKLEREQLAIAMSALRRIAALHAEREGHARRIAGFVDTAAERLDHAERQGSYEAVVSPVRNGRQIAARLRVAIDTLADAARRRDHAQARDDLHALFETFGREELFTQHGIAYLIGKQRTLAMRGEFDRWERS